MNKISYKFENWPDGPINLMSYVPLIFEKASFSLCHQRNSFSFDQIFLKLSDKEDMDEISDKIENWPDRLINPIVTSPGLLKKPLIDYVISITCSVLIGSKKFLKLADKVTWMKSLIS